MSTYQQSIVHQLSLLYNIGEVMKMKRIKTTLNQEVLIQKLNLVLNENSSYALVENGIQGVDNCINIYFNPEDLLDAKERLKQSGYYDSLVIEHLIGKQGEDVHLISLKDIIYIEGINNDTYVYTKQDSFTVKEKLYELEKSLHQMKFVRISKSFIVSIHKIKKIKPTFNGKLLLLLDNNVKLEVSRHYISSFKKYLGM